MNQVRKTSMNAIAAAFDAAAKKSGLKISEVVQNDAAKEGVVLPNPPRQKREWRNSAFDKKVQWGHELFGTLNVAMQNFPIGEVEQVGVNTWVRVAIRHHEPRELTLQFSAVAEKNVKVFRAQDGNVVDCSDGKINPLTVRVNWKEGDERRNDDPRPHTRKTNADNIDLVFLRPDGMFVQLQVGVVTRKGTFWVTVQEIYAGQIVRTTLAKAKELGINYHEAGEFATFVAPIASENAYAGADYLRTFKNMGPKVIDFALGYGAICSLSKAAVSDWVPDELDELPEGMKKNGWLRAVPTFFNLISGTGYGVCEDGESCFLHFTSILDDANRPIASKGEFPVLQPMVGIALKKKFNKERNRMEATAIRAPSAK